jgi:maleylpyruvate isomerase
MAGAARERRDGADAPFDPGALLVRIADATAHVLATAARLGDEAVRAPSLLPGWTRGHVLTHLARNADGGRRLLDWARTGVATYEYRDLPTRDREIEEGAGRSAAELAEDVRESAERFARAYRAMTRDAWHREVRWTAGQWRPALRAADARLTEVLVHHVDLAAGYRPADWPRAFVEEQLGRVTAAFHLRAQAPALVLHVTDGTRPRYAVGPGERAVAVEGAGADLLAWLMGRSRGDGVAVHGGVPLPRMPFLY